MPSPTTTQLHRRALGAVQALAGHGAHARALVLDRLHGVRTAEMIPLEELGLEHPLRVAHCPSPWGTARRVLAHADIRATDVFVDIGSGLGRVVYLAARHPFARVEGVELSAELAERSRANLDRVRGRLRARDVRVVNADVLEYELPDDVTYVYCFNPFKQALFDSFLDQLLASLDRCPRVLTLIYLHPLEHERVLATGRGELVEVRRGSRLLPGPREPHTAYVYRLR